MKSLSVNEWSLIAGHINVEDWLNFSLICKTSFSGLKMNHSLKQNGKLCMKCGGKTYRHEADPEGHCYDVFEKLGMLEYFCISEHTNGEIWYICFKCDVFHLECPSCGNYCRLVGFPCEKADDGEMFHIVENGERHVFEKMEYSDDDEEMYPEGWIPIPGEWNIFHLDRSKWSFTGIDGSRRSKMECKTCDYEFEFWA